MRLSPHYIVGEERIYNQLEAWARIKSSGSSFRFYFYEHEYDSVDWTQNPTSSWDDLLLLRCLQLRNKYPKLGLFYTGGRDSHHILMTFEKHNIKLDCLILWHMPYNSYRSHEYLTYTLPLAEEYAKNHPETEIKTIVVDKQAYEDFYSDAWLEDFDRYWQWGYFQPTESNFMLGLLPWDMSQWGVINGLDKPKIRLIDNEWFLTNIDKMFECHIGSEYNLEYFYYAPDLPELHVKQTWMLIDYLETHYTSITPEFVDKFNNNPHSGYYNELCLACGRGPAIRPDLPYQNGQNKYKLGGGEAVFDNIRSLAKDQEWNSYKNYEYALRYITEKFPDIFNNNNPLHSGTIGIWGKHYKIKNYQDRTRLF